MPPFGAFGHLDPVANAYDFAAAMGYETVVHGTRPRPWQPRPPSVADRAWIGYTNTIAADRERQRILGGREDVFARADWIRRTRTATDATSTGAGRGIDWDAKFKSLRPTQERFQIPYKGPNTLGPPPVHRTTLGQKIWEFVQQQKKMQARLAEGTQRLGSCYATTVQRMQQGWQAAFSKPLLEGRSAEQKKVFDAIAGTRYFTYKQLWKDKVPKNLRFTGVGGALAYLGKAKVVDTAGVWRGDLEPGAPLQMWFGATGYPPGHSGVFERYTHDKQGRITGFVYSDQWRDYNVMRRPGQGYLLAPKIFGAQFWG